MFRPHETVHIAPRPIRVWPNAELGMPERGQAPVFLLSLQRFGYGAFLDSPTENAFACAFSPVENDNAAAVGQEKEIPQRKRVWAQG